MKRLIVLLAAGAFAAGSSPAHAQIGVAVHGGSLGVGADLGYSVHPRVTLRAGGNFFPFNLDITASDIEYTFDFPSPQLTAAVDLFLVGNLRFSGGAVYSPNSFAISATPTTLTEIGIVSYTPAQIGSLTGSFVTNKLAPFVSLGWGNIATSKVGFFFDLGVSFTGSPSVELATTGGVVSQLDLTEEAAQFEDDISVFKYYPIATLGLSFAIPMGGQ